MNIKIKNQNLCFKITKNELDQLRNGNHLNETITFLDNDLIVTINPKGKKGEMTSRLTIDQNDAYLILSVSHERLEELDNMGKSRNGLQQEDNGILTSLQVDVRKASR